MRTRVLPVLMTDCSTRVFSLSLRTPVLTNERQRVVLERASVNPYPNRTLCKTVYGSAVVRCQCVVLVR